MYSLYEVHAESGEYVLLGRFESEQECNQEAFELGVLMFRIEQQIPGGSVIVFESSNG